VEWGDVLRAVVANPLGVSALGVLGLVLVAAFLLGRGGVGLRLAVLGGLLLAGAALVAVAIREREELERSVKVAKSLVKLATETDVWLTALEKPDAQDVETVSDIVVLSTALLSRFVDSVPALVRDAEAASAQRRLASKRSAMLPGSDPQTGEMLRPTQPLDAETKADARELSRAVRMSLERKDPLELRELLHGREL
jgi:hypothetical protein